ncbi:MAG: glucose 1-dehydrogenase [Rhodospirillales bacterium]
MRLKDKVAVVTGAGSGFGEGIARRFAEEGARVVVADIDEDAGRRVAGDIGGAVFSHTDVTDSARVKAMIGTAETSFGGLDILVNNAGVAQRRMPMLDVPEDAFDRIFAVNVKSIYLAAIHGVPALRARGGGVILNTASTAAVSPRPGLTWYNGSKGAVVTLTRSMAAELAPEGIRVNALNPVIGETGLLAEFMGGEDTPEIREQFIATIPLGRMSTAKDVANAALFLASDEAEFLTGVCLEVDGGRCI